MALLTAPSDTVLWTALAAALERIGLSPLLELRRRPSPYRTSFPLEELELTLANGDRLELAFKQLDWDSLEEEAQIAKPTFLHDPRREIEVYASLLAPAGIGPRYYGATIEPEQERHWLFVEWVEGRELYQVGELELWRAVARWLGGRTRRLPSRGIAERRCRCSNTTPPTIAAGSSGRASCAGVGTQRQGGRSSGCAAAMTLLSKSCSSCPRR